MRKHEKEMVLQAVEQLEHAVNALRNLHGKALAQSGVDLLAEMQETAIAVGNLIEKTEGTGHPVVARLEELCEIEYRCSLQIMDGKSIHEACTAMREQLLGISKEVKKIPEKKEILFLPYQVSMWDSLESVWMAAQEDPRTDCYVVPLPVYDVRQDNSLGELHYEGSRYPDYVPVTSYMDYNIEERQPDVIYIHNPYDEANTVTRVPEQYYARNLKKYTKMLVYIPYLLSEYGGPEDQQCFMPGVLYADRVVVQSGSIYKKYCRVYTNFIRQNRLEQVMLRAEEKFLPLGSPKIDKVINTKCEIEDLPKSWQKVILKPDGSRKKIVLYNLTITALLGNSEKILLKLDEVLQKFKERKDEIVLLWRPHPLLLNTINAMRPYLRDAYMQKVSQFKTEGWGIFDETPDPNLAMVLSDAYYGDFSSLITSYRMLHKPMLLQNIDSV